MTFQVNGRDIGEAIEIAVFVGSALAMLIAGALVYLMVRPPRHVRMARKAGLTERRTGLDPDEAEEMWALIDRMESRLEVLERAMHDQIGHAERPALGRVRNDETFEPADHGRDAGRTE